MNVTPRPKQRHILQALEETRTFLEERYVAALDDDDAELAGAYRHTLEILARTVLLEGTRAAYDFVARLMDDGHGSRRN